MAFVSAAIDSSLASMERSASMTGFDDMFSIDITKYLSFYLVNVSWTCYIHDTDMGGPVGQHDNFSLGAIVHCTRRHILP